MTRGRPLDYYWGLQFEWDESKSEYCFLQRGFDFAYASQAFQDPQQRVQADTRWEYGEQRFQLLGQIDGRVFVVIFAERATRIRIISARKANSREIKFYEHQPRSL